VDRHARQHDATRCSLGNQFDIFNILVEDRPKVVGFHDPYDYLRPGLATCSLKDPQSREVPEGKHKARCGH
jgi:hypothetical protein